MRAVRASDLRNWKPSAEYLQRLETARMLTDAARELEAPPQYECGNAVHCRGEALSSPIYWLGRQWAVTSYGVECRDGTYVISKDRLWENDDVHSWVRHMAGKDWPDLEDFAEALRLARRHWREECPRPKLQ